MNLIPSTATAGAVNVGSTSFKAVCELWASMPDSKDWSEVKYVHEIGGHPRLVMICGDSEIFAVLDVFDRRVVDEDEFPSCQITQSKPAFGCPPEPLTAREKREKHRRAKKLARRAQRRIDEKVVRPVHFFPTCERTP